MEAFETLSLGAILFDRATKGGAANDPARLLCDDSFGVHRDQSVHVADKAAQTALERHLAAACRSDTAADSEALLPVSIPRPGKHPLQIQAHALGGANRSCFSAGHVVAVLRPLDRTTSPRHRVLRQMFNRSAAESTLTAALLRPSISSPPPAGSTFFMGRRARSCGRCGRRPTPAISLN